MSKLGFGGKLTGLDSWTNVGLDVDYCYESQFSMDCLMLSSILQKTASQVSKTA